MTDPLLCTIHRVNSNKSHTHIPEIYNAEKRNDPFDGCCNGTICSEFNGFNNFPTVVLLGPDLELSSTVCVAINLILYSLRSVDFVYHSVVNKRS